MPSRGSKALAQVQTFVTLSKEASRVGVEVSERQGGLFHLKFGSMLVSYWPYKEPAVAKVEGTTVVRKGVSMEEAIQMAVNPPARVRKDLRDDLLVDSRSLRKKLYKRQKMCYWCQAPLTIDDSTLEHLIPHSRGGTNEERNLTLACRDCNSIRGDSMPELQYEKLQSTKTNAEYLLVLKDVGRLSKFVQEAHMKLAKLKKELSRGVKSSEKILKESENRTRIQLLGAKTSLRECRKLMKVIELEDLNRMFMVRAKDLMPEDMYRRILTSCKGDS